MVVIESGLIKYAVIYVIGVFQPKQIKTCAIVSIPFEILCEAAENLTCTRELFLYNLLCMTHHIIFVNKFVSKALTETEQKYSIIEGEAPGLV